VDTGILQKNHPVFTRRYTPLSVQVLHAKSRFTTAATRATFNDDEVEFELEDVM